MTYLILSLSVPQESSGKQTKQNKNQSYFQAKDRTKPLLCFVDICEQQPG